MTAPFKLDLTHRPRRLRRTPALRALVEETVLRPQDFIAPLFVIDGDGVPEEIASMPGVKRFPIGLLVEECKALFALGVQAVALFPKLDVRFKDEDGNEALNPDTLVLRAVRAIKKQLPGMVVMTDIALDPYTTHGHDGLLNEAGDYVENDRTVDRLCAMSVLHARTGVDLVAPSDMMDGRIGAIRQALNAENFDMTGIMAYTAKYASAFYGPFRDAVGSASAAGTHHLDKKTYQLNPANRREAFIEAALDDGEGADMIMVKPAGAYLDIIRDLREVSHRPLAAYQVSGEYAQIQAAARLGWLDLAKTRHESLIAIKRAGADMILTYFAKDEATDLLRQQGVPV